MAKKRLASSARVKPRAKSVKYIPDSQLDLTDIPEATDEQLRRARRVGRPTTGNAKHLIAIRISPNVLWKLRRLAAKQSKPYQTFIHELLERAVSKKVA
jgi:predicted DNA binding CopG/RHH family protein